MKVGLHVRHVNPVGLRIEFTWSTDGCVLHGAELTARMRNTVVSCNLHGANQGRTQDLGVN